MTNIGIPSAVAFLALLSGCDAAPTKQTAQVAQKPISLVPPPPGVPATARQVVGKDKIRLLLFGNRVDHILGVERSGVGAEVFHPEGYWFAWGGVEVPTGWSQVQWRETMVCVKKFDATEVCSRFWIDAAKKRRVFIQHSSSNKSESAYEVAIRKYDF